MKELVIAGEGQGRALVKVCEGRVRAVHPIEGQDHAVFLVVIETAVGTNRVTGGECPRIEVEAILWHGIAGMLPNVNDIPGVQDCLDLLARC